MAIILDPTNGITNVNGTAAAPAITGTDTDTGLYFGTNTLGLSTNGTNGIYMDASQNVGIGLSNPNCRLHAQGGTNVDGSLTFNQQLTSNAAYNASPATGTLVSLKYTSGGSFAGMGGWSISKENTTDGDYASYMTFYTRPNGGTNTERIRIDSAGNVGINATQPSLYGCVTEVGGYAATSYSNLSVQTPSDAQGRRADISLYSTFQGTADNGARRTADIIAGFNGGAWGSEYLSFNVGNNGSANDSRVVTSEKMRIDSSGNVMVGTTSGTGKLNSSADGSTIPMFRTYDTYSSAATNNTWSIFRNGSQVGTVTTTLSATAYNTSSDYRLKEEIVPIQNALDKVALLKPVTYKWKVDGSDGEGFIAHELAEVCPQAVSGEKDAVDEEGNPKYQGIDTSFLVATLTKAIQELKAIVDAQQQRIEALEGK